MKQVLQYLGTGETVLAEVPSPGPSSNSLTIKTSKSLISLGTEKMLIQFGRSGLIAKARAQPDKVKQVIQKIKTDGLWATVDAVKSKLDTPIQLGYCNVGKVAALPSNSRFSVGDRVVSNGPHAEFVSVGENLVAKIPDNVTDDHATFAVLGAIALQGIRLLHPTIGERIVVSGLGLIGLLAVQILRANGCQVLGIDFDAKKLELAKAFGAEVCDLSVGQDPTKVVEQWTEGIGVDGVLITASTKSDELIHQAAVMCRQRGRIVLVGVIGLNLQRADFYEKELTFQVSCSYGPGRYDDDYEKRGIDYPIGFVRWTEKRNFEAVLKLMSDGKIDVSQLISDRFDFEDVLVAYQSIERPDAMGILLSYSGSDNIITESVSANSNRSLSGAQSLYDMKPVELTGLCREVAVGFVGAGGFATRMLMPNLPKLGVNRRSVASSSGITAAHAARKFGFARTFRSTDDLLNDPELDAVFLTTPHNLHSRMVCQALNLGKHVFVEKPLALNLEEIDEVERAIRANPGCCLMVGFNRRFSPHMRALREWSRSAPSNKSIIITVNAGAVPADHWTQDPRIGGGRIIGEACHFIDLARFLIGHPIVGCNSFPIRGGDGRLGDCAAIQLAFKDGSTTTIHYLSNGNKSFPKERIEVFAGGKVLVCDNFRKSLEIGGRRSLKTSYQDKGHRVELHEFIRVLKDGGEWPIPVNEILEVSRFSILASEFQ